jgi:hypothetical protein
LSQFRACKRENRQKTAQIVKQDCLVKAKNARVGDGGVEMLYRIFTEDVQENHDKLTELITQFYEGFTIVRAAGYWRLQPENSLIIEIITVDEDAKVKALAAAIRDANNQECVLVQRIENSQWFV